MSKIGGNVYERELKYILTGNTKKTIKLLSSFSTNEKNIITSLEKKPFFVVRAAGSFGIDLVVLRNNVSFLIEVKSSSKKIFYFSKNILLSNQLEYISNVCSSTLTIPFYAFRLKGVSGDPWRIFSINLKNTPLLFPFKFYDQIPKIETNSKGNSLMLWDNGLKLSTFIYNLNSF